MRLKRRPRQRSGIQRVPSKRFPAHRKWVRGEHCAVNGKKGTWGPAVCVGRIEAAHVRNGLPVEDRGGEGIKPHDKWCLPLCHAHHQHQHRIGEMAFEGYYGIDMKAIAEDLAARSPHRKGWEDA